MNRKKKRGLREEDNDGRGRDPGQKHRFLSNDIVPGLDQLINPSFVFMSTRVTHLTEKYMTQKPELRKRIYAAQNYALT